MTGKEACSTTLVVRPNRSLSPAGILGVFVALCVPALSIGIGLAWIGAWMILPFSGLEILAIALLCRWFYRHRDDSELIAIEPERVRVIQRNGRTESCHEFPRYWVRVVLDRRDDERPSRLQIGSHGRYVRLAEHINEGDRQRLARELRNALQH